MKATEGLLSRTKDYPILVKREVDRKPYEDRCRILPRFKPVITHRKRLAT